MSPPRIFNLVLGTFGVEWHKIRVAELESHVDYIVFVQSSFRFSDGTNITAEFPSQLLSGPNVRRIVVDRLPFDCKKTRIPALCRENIVRNELGRAFDDLGGTAFDWVIISDGDEIPDRALMQRLRAMGPLSKPYNHTIVQLDPYHRFKYGVHCEEVSNHIGQPQLTSGKVLRDIGSVAVKQSWGHYCRAYGYNSHCLLANWTIAYKPTIVRWPNTSWHFSSASDGGVRGLISKKQSNADHTSSRAQNLTSNGEIALMIEKVSRCEEDAQNADLAFARRRPMDGHAEVKTFLRTPWGLGGPLPAYPDVPHALERLLRAGELPHLLGDWSVVVDSSHLQQDNRAPR